MYPHAVGFVSAFLPPGMGVGARVCGADSRAQRRHFRRVAGVLWLTAVALFGCGGRSTSSERLTKEDAGNTAVAAGSADGAVGAAALAEGGGVDEAGSSNASGAGADGGGAATAPGPSTTACVVLASNYDQSCSADTDCAPVYSGYVCVPNCFCPQSAINVGALVQFNSDVAALENAAAGGSNGQTGSGLGCGCNPVKGCCQSGQCVVANGCQATADAGLAMVDASVYTPTPDYTVLCVGDAGPTDSGAAVPGLSRWCDGPEVCAPFNGGWECCGPTMGTFTPCIAP
jgi:hypothetical protein